MNASFRDLFPVRHFRLVDFENYYKFFRTCVSWRDLVGRGPQAGYCEGCGNYILKSSRLVHLKTTLWTGSNFIISSLRDNRLSLRSIFFTPLAVFTVCDWRTTRFQYFTQRNTRFRLSLFTPLAVFSAVCDSRTSGFPPCVTRAPPVSAFHRL